ncbi:MAG: hypothetical protein GVY19_05690 [Bacteroidetes bacterium]|jgi:hypothetical protein|nr:hypothetical protein [Bacteroidota bacterium]
MKNSSYLTFLLILVIGVVSCSQHSKVEFGVKQEYLLDESESVMPVTQDLIDEYNSYFSYDTLNFPANKGIQSKDRKVLTGMVVDGNIEIVAHRIEHDTFATMLGKQQFQIHEVPVASYFYKKKNQYIHALLYDFENDQFSLGIMVAFLSPDSLKATQTLDKAYLEHKLNIHNK